MHNPYHRVSHKQQGRHTHHVVGVGKEEVSYDASVGHARDVKGDDHILEVAAHQNDAGGIHGNVGSCPGFIKGSEAWQ